MALQQRVRVLESQKGVNSTFGTDGTAQAVSTPTVSVIANTGLTD